MKSIYTHCPQFENKRFLLRLVSVDDVSDLLKVYSDKQAVQFMNSDNCGGDTFYYPTIEQMKKAIDFWLFEYRREGFVRFSIVDKEINTVIGTIECFHRISHDYFNHCALLRLDLHRKYEISKDIQSILSLFIDSVFPLFNCDKIATKSIDQATERIGALKQLGFLPTHEKLVGHDGTPYDSYYVLKNNSVR